MGDVVYVLSHPRGPTQKARDVHPSRKAVAEPHKGVIGNVCSGAVFRKLVVEK